MSTTEYLLDNGVYTTFRYWPLNKVDLFSEFIEGDYPNTEYISNTTLNLPLHQSLSDIDIEKIIDLIKAFNI